MKKMAVLLALVALAPALVFAAEEFVTWGVVKSLYTPDGMVSQLETGPPHGQSAPEELVIDTAVLRRAIEERFGDHPRLGNLSLDALRPAAEGRQGEEAGSIYYYLECDWPSSSTYFGTDVFSFNIVCILTLEFADIGECIQIHDVNISWHGEWGGESFFNVDMSTANATEC